MRFGSRVCVSTLQLFLQGLQRSKRVHLLNLNTERLGSHLWYCKISGAM